ncbi:MAG: alpha/beta fold hydrolase [Planctomycetota bacterium]
MGTIVALIASIFISDGKAGSQTGEEAAPTVERVAYVQNDSDQLMTEAAPDETNTEAAHPQPERWIGRIDLLGPQLDFAISIELTEDGWVGTIDIPAQNVAGLPLKDIERTPTSLVFAAELPGLPEINWPKWELQIAEFDTSASGVLLQSGMEFETTARLADVDTPILERPQHPTAPLPYRTDEVTIPVEAADEGQSPEGKAGHTLAGTLVLPDTDTFGAGPYPTAIFITGSGPQDRDETLMGHKPFLVVADRLAKRGIASLRCDDRGVGASTGDFESATTTDFAHDVRAQVRFIADRPETGSIGLIGHSEGGLVAPMVAADTPAVEWLALLAAPGVPGDAILAEQIQSIFRAEGFDDEEALTAMADAQQASFEAMRAGDRDGAIEALTRLIRLQNDAAGAPNEPAALAQAASDYFDTIDTPWFRAFLTIDPRQALRVTSQPVLILNGSLDTQVLPDQNVPEITKALADAGNDKVTIHVLDGLNHLFQPAQTGALSEYGAIPTTFDEDTMVIIADWILGLENEPGDEPPGSRPDDQ